MSPHEMDAVFSRDGTSFRPSASATGPWAADRLHGGPVLGLLARAIEALSPEPAFVPARIKADMFRAVPHAPLEVRTEVVRRSSRLCLIGASLWSGSEEFVRADALLLRAADLESPQFTAAAVPLPLHGLPTESLMRGRGTEAPNLPPGFHTRVQTRWVPRAAGEPLAIWFRLPMPLVAGETPSAFQSAVALSDFTNAVASIAVRERDRAVPPYINVDTTLYLTRRPEGEWFCLRENAIEATRGISLAEVVLHDERGPFGRAMQARLAQGVR